MKFSQNGLYIESYSKCPNCGNLMYENSAADRANLVVHDKETYCSQRCVDWKLDRDRRRASASA
jgi:N-methylhydantoinase B